MVSTRTGPRWRAIGPHSSTGDSNPMRREEVGKIIDGQIEQRGRPPRRHAALVNGEGDHFHERLRERRRQTADTASRPLLRRAASGTVRATAGFSRSSATSRHFSAEAVT